MTPLAAGLTQKLNLPQHLRELSQLVGRTVEPEELLSLAETEAVRAQGMTVQRQPSWQCELRFSDMRSARFGRLLQAFRERNPSPVYLWTPLSNDCGLLRPVPFSDVRFDFDFAVNRDGILELLTAGGFAGPDAARLFRRPGWRAAVGSGSGRCELGTSRVLIASVAPSPERTDGARVPMN